VKTLRVAIARALIALAQQLLTFPINAATNCDIDGHDGLFQRYTNYGIWLCCGTRQDEPYDVELAPGTDFADWEAES